MGHVDNGHVGVTPSLCRNHYIIINPCLQHGIVKRVMQLVCLNKSALVVLDFETRKRLHHSKT